MRHFKFGNRYIYKVPGVEHKFYNEQDAQFYCREHGIDVKTITRYASTKEYDRWLVLQQMQKEGKISDLQRQVVYELIPAKTEKVYVKDKVVNHWIVENKPFRTKKEAQAYCKSIRLQTAAAICVKESTPVYKDVTIEHNAVYTADFVYHEAGKLVVEDVKSDITRKEKDYVLRRKLMLHVHGIRILET